MKEHQLFPPLYVVDALANEAARSPCAKSKRGVLIVDPDLADEGGDYRWSIRARGHNAPPEPMVCGGHGDEIGALAACRASCGKVAEHAEVAALRVLSSTVWNDSYGLHLIHGELVDGAIVACDGPSCWQCSKAILADGRISAVWLYESDANQIGGVWRSYSALDFHCATLRHPKNNLYCRSSQ